MQCSVAHHQLDLFAPERWPRRPYCSDDLSQGLRIRSLKDAITKPYIQANPPHLRVWSIHDCDYPGAALAWEDAGLPPPSWAAASPSSLHAHLVWGLSAPVLVDGLSARDAPMRYLAAVESCMRERLHADPGYSGLITKNPAHPHWRVLRGPRMGYELAELVDLLDLQKHKPYLHRSIEPVGLGRNVITFDRTRKWSYPNVRSYWGGGLQGWNAWLAAVYGKALEYNGEFQHPLDEREVWHIGKSVAKWVWRRFTPSSFALYVSATHTSEIQRNRRLKTETKDLEKWLLNTQ